MIAVMCTTINVESFDGLNFHDFENCFCIYMYFCKSITEYKSELDIINIEDFVTGLVKVSHVHKNSTPLK